MSIPASPRIRTICLIPFTIFRPRILQVISSNSVHFTQSRKVPERRRPVSKSSRDPYSKDAMPKSGTILPPKWCNPSKSATKSLFLTTLSVKLLVFNRLREPLPRLTAPKSGTYLKTAKKSEHRWTRRPNRTPRPACSGSARRREREL